MGTMGTNEATKTTQKAAATTTIGGWILLRQRFVDAAPDERGPDLARPNARDNKQEELDTFNHAVERILAAGGGWTGSATGVSRCGVCCRGRTTIWNVSCCGAAATLALTDTGWLSTWG